MEENVKFEQYEKHYSEEGFWDKLKNFAVKAGGKVIYSALKLYYAAQRKETPGWAKSTIFGSLGYLILPIDLIPDTIPVAGFIDDSGLLMAALLVVASYINDENKEQAKQKMRDWFGDSELAKLDD